MQNSSLYIYVIVYDDIYRLLFSFCKVSSEINVVWYIYLKELLN